VLKLKRGEGFKSFSLKIKRKCIKIGGDLSEISLGNGGNDIKAKISEGIWKIKGV
jgi:uncharacterized Zn ribbon protein